MTLNLNQYGTAFQIKVISALLTHKEFLITSMILLVKNIGIIKHISGLLKK